MKTEHIDYLRLHLSNARSRLAERPDNALLAVFVAQAERELEGELEFLGITDTAVTSRSNTEMLAELFLS